MFSWDNEFVLFIFGHGFACSPARAHVPVSTGDQNDRKPAGNMTRGLIGRAYLGLLALLPLLSGAEIPERCDVFTIEHQLDKGLV